MKLAILFDLDGTLIDTAPDIAWALNQVVTAALLRPFPIKEVRLMIGQGVERLVAQAFDARRASLSEAQLAFHTREMVRIYEANLHVQSKLMPFARECLSQLYLAGYTLGVVTNKPQALSEKLLKHFDLAQFVPVIRGLRPAVRRKPAPDMLQLAMAELEALKAIMVGDSISDVESAHACGLQAIIVKGGYTVPAPEYLGADLVLDNLEQLFPTLRHLEC